MNVCGRCDLEIRLGWRAESPLARPDQLPFWMHRDPADDADHRPVHGRPSDEEWEARLEAGRHARWTTTITRNKREVEIETSAAEFDAAKQGVDEDGEDVVAEVIPAPEVLAHPVDKLDADHVPGGAKQIWNLAEKNGWAVVRHTYSRGPRTHASWGTLLGMSDYFVLGLVLDGTDRRAVASWEDGKFAFAYIMRADLERQKYITDRVNSDGLKAWIRNED